MAIPQNLRPVGDADAPAPALGEISIRRVTDVADAGVLHEVAAATFPLACPPDADPAAIQSFIDEQLSRERFAAYLADPTRDLLLASVDAVPSGYTMLVTAEPTDPDVLASITARPTSELSKFYLLPGHHGSGLSAALMTATLDAARERGSAAAWLGVNDQNARANRFYEKNGFVTVGHKKFKLGDRWESDFVKEHVFVTS